MMTVADLKKRNLEMEGADRAVRRAARRQPGTHNICSHLFTLTVAEMWPVCTI